MEAVECSVRFHSAKKSKINDCTRERMNTLRLLDCTANTTTICWEHHHRLSCVISPCTMHCSCCMVMIAQGIFGAFVDPGSICTSGFSKVKSILYSTGGQKVGEIAIQVRRSCVERSCELVLLSANIHISNLRYWKNTVSTHSKDRWFDRQLERDEITGTAENAALSEPDKGTVCTTAV